MKQRKPERLQAESFHALNPSVVFSHYSKRTHRTQDRSDDQEPENRNKTETSHLAVHSARWLAAFVFLLSA